MWTKEHEQVLEILRTHSQDPNLRNGIYATQTVVELEIRDFAIENIKQFERLYRYTNELVSLGDDKPQDTLIKVDADNVTLHSDDNYRKQVLYLRVENTINKPITQADKKTRKQFIQFAQWCAKEATFTNSKMNDQLKKIGVLNYKAFNEAMLFELLHGFKLEVKRNKKTNIISCTEC